MITMPKLVHTPSHTINSTHTKHTTFDLLDCGTQFHFHFFGRAAGRKALRVLEDALLDIEDGSTLLIDLDGVELMDFTFADEALAGLFLRMEAGVFGERSIAFCASPEFDTARFDALMDNITVAFEHRGVIGLLYESPMLPGARYSHVFGSLAAHLQDVMRCIGAGEMTAVQLQDKMDLSHRGPNAVLGRLSVLMRHHLLHRRGENVPVGGKHYVYRNIV